MTRSHTLTALGIVLLVLAAAIGSAAPASLDSRPDDALAQTAVDMPADLTRESYGETRWVVQLSSSDDYSTLEDWANASDDRHIVDELDATNRTVVAAPRDQIGATIIQRVLNRGLAHSSYVTSVEPDLVVERPEPVGLASNTTYTRTRAQRLVELSSSGTFSKTGMAWQEDASETTLAEARSITNSDAVSSTGNGMLVAVVDTGANTANGRVFGNGTSDSDIRIDNASKNFISGASVDASAGNFSAIEDGNGHGTWTAAAVAANTSSNATDGMAPDASLLVLKALDDEGSGSSHDIAQAIRYAADEDADVLSLSLGSQFYSEEIASAVEHAESEGTVVVVAAGNSRQTAKWVASPADTPGNSITVAAANVSENDSVNATLPAYFSQVGPDPGSSDLSGGVTTDESVTLAAPGMQVLAATPTTGGRVSNSTLSGTSMSTPLVAGGIAQVLASDTGLQGDPEAVHDRVADSSAPMPKASAAAVGNGYLDVEAFENGTETAAQADEMTSEAEARDAGLRGLSDAQGGVWFNVWSATDIEVL